jgi:hypothetical protein
MPNAIQWGGNRGESDTYRFVCEQGNNGNVENPEGSNDRNNNDNDVAKVKRLRTCASALKPLGAKT